MRTIIIALAGVALASQANALTAFSVGASGGVDPGYSTQTEVVNFDTAPAAGVIETDTGAVGLYTGTSGSAATPVGDTSQYEAIQPGGNATFNFASYAPGVSSLSLYAGSIDGYNSFSVTTNLHTYNFTGNDFLNHNGDQTSSATNRRVFFNFAPNENLETISLKSSGTAFEYDTIAVGAKGQAPIVAPPGSEALYPSSVPEPASWAMMLVGFGGAGALMRKRRTLVAI